eukprot:TRINITY_DN1774_c0_g1_i1.p1 TRINITY_DN1774_c0_g1~~TRINITY_DN1774_c0_g1_i1.p1  ORF type:complete len:447 (-),score=129.70 TRINITY_DN1774_c0_g1_i1:1052-2299(-)
MQVYVAECKRLRIRSNPDFRSVLKEFDSLDYFRRLFYSGSTGSVLGVLGPRCLCPLLQHSPSLVSISLQANGMEDAGVKDLMQGLKGHPTLEELNLDRNGITSAGIKCIVDFIHSSKSLRVLSLEGNAINNDGAEKLFNSLSKNLVLDTLNVSHCGLTGDIAKSLASLISVNLKISDLRLSRNRLGNQFVGAIAPAWQRSRVLARMELAQTGIGFSGGNILLAVIKRNPRISHVDFSQNLGIPAKVRKAVEAELRAHVGADVSPAARKAASSRSAKVAKEVGKEMQYAKFALEDMRIVIETEKEAMIRSLEDENGRLRSELKQRNELVKEMERQCELAVVTIRELQRHEEELRLALERSDIGALREENEMLREERRLLLKALVESKSKQSDRDSESGSDLSGGEGDRDHGAHVQE